MTLEEALLELDALLAPFTKGYRPVGTQGDEERELIYVAYLDRASRLTTTARLAYEPLIARLTALERVAEAARLHSYPGVHGRCGICAELSALDALAQRAPAQEAG